MANYRARDLAPKKRALRSLTEYEEKLSMNVENTIYQIKERARAIHNELDRFIAIMVRQLKSKFEDECGKIGAAMNRLKGQIRSNSVDRGSNRSPRSKFSSRNSDFDFEIDDYPYDFKAIDLDNRFERKEVTFIEGEINEKNLSNLVGMVTFETITPIAMTRYQKSLDVTARSEVRMVKAFRVGNQSETVHAIAPVGVSTAWTCCGWGSRKLYKFNRDGQKIKSTTLEIQVNDVTAIPDDGTEDAVLISSYREKSIKKLHPDSSRTMDFAYISLYPGGLCSDKNSDVYVCFRDSYTKPVTFGSRRMVARLSRHGEIVQSFEKDEEQKNIFGYPFRVAVNVNGDICVSDYGDGTRGVTILDTEGNIKCVYKGPPSGMAPHQAFLPHGICCDRKGYIFVSDWNNDCVHVLDQDGIFQMLLVTSRDGLEGPNAIAVDNDGYLWVGDSHGSVRIFKYKLFRDKF